jgi:ribonuclease BN (tRNA processing enzyme)
MKRNDVLKKKLLSVTLACLFVLTLASVAVSAAQTSDGFVVTIIGSGNPLLSSRRGGPSTLVQYRDKRFLVDCGPGAIAGLLKLDIEPGKIRNMLFTHHHADHNADYWSFAIGGWGNPGGRRELNLVGPSGTKTLHQITLDFYKTDLDYRIDVVGFPDDGLRSNVNIKELMGNSESFELDGVRITTLLVPHTIETYAYRFDAGGQAVVISGDLTYTPRFAPFAKGADIIVFDGQMSVDFTNLRPIAAMMARHNLLKSHISNPEIAKLAAETSPGKFILSHLCGNMDLPGNKKLYREAGYKGEVIEAYDGLRITP